MKSKLFESISYWMILTIRFEDTMWCLKIAILAFSWSTILVPALAKLNQPKISVSSLSRNLNATHFPFVVKDGIKLHYDASNDGLFDMPILAVQVFNGTLIPSNPFPGLYVNNINKTLIEATGPIEDLQLWIESGRNSTDYSNKFDEYVEPGGGIRYIPPFYDWIGKAVVHFTLHAPQQKQKKNNYKIPSAFAKVEMDVDPYLEMKINVTMLSNRITTVEDKLFYPFDSESNGIGVTFENVARRKIIHCVIRSSSGIFDRTHINGTIDILNKTLADIRYTPQTNFNGKVTVTISCRDDTAKQNHRATSEIVVLPVNDPPIITSHSAKVFETWEDTSVQLGPYASLFIVDVDVRESDKALLAVDLAISAGKATLQLPPSEKLGSLYITSNSTSHLRLLGHIDQINFVLQFISLSFSQDWYGKGKLNVQCTDEIVLGDQPMEVIYGNWVSDSIDFTVKSVNDEPTILPKASLFENIMEGDTVYFKDRGITIVDVDSRDNDPISFSIEIKAVKGIIPGRIEVEDQSISSMQTKLSSGNSSTFSVKTNLPSLYQYLESMRLVLLQDWFGICFDCISIHVIDGYGGEAKKNLTFSVQAVPDSPSLKLSTTELTSNEDEEIMFSSVMNVTVYDADVLYSNHDSMFEVIIHSSMNGLIGLKDHVPGCYITKGRPYVDLESILSFKGSIDVITMALNSLYYIPPSDLDSSDTLSFKVVDESLLYDKIELLIKFDGIDDPPSVFINDIVKSLDIHGRPMLKTGIRITDVDTKDVRFKLTLTLDPVGAVTIDCPRLENSNINVRANETGKLILFGKRDSINWIADEVILNFNDQFTGFKVTLVAEVEDEEGMVDRASAEIFTEANQKVPFLLKSDSSTTILEDNSLYINPFVEIQGDFDDSLIFEVKFACNKNLTSAESLSFGGRFQFDDLSLPGVHILSYDTDRGNLDDIVFRGNVRALRYALNKLYVKPPLHFFGVFTLAFGVRARNDPLYDDTYIVDDILVDVEKVDDAPIVLWDGMYFVDKNPVLDMDEDTFRNFGSRFTVKDIDDNGGTFSAAISSSFGNICSHLEGSTFFQNAAFTFFDSDEARQYACLEGNRLEMLITITELNDVLRTLIYKPDPNWWGVDEIKLQLLSNEIEVETSIRVAVRPTQDETCIHLPYKVLTVEEDSELAIDMITLSDDDINPPESPQNNICGSLPQQCRITVTVKVSHGTLHVVTRNDAISFRREKNKVLVINGLIEDINQSLSSLVYHPDKNYRGEDKLHIASKSAIGNSASERLVIKVKWVNHGPVLLLPTPSESVFTLLEDTEGIIGDDECHDPEKPSPYITCQKIIIQDVDNTWVEDTTIKLSLFSENGSFKIPRLRLANNVSVTQSNFSSQGFSKAVELVGPLESLNWVLTGLTFKGKANYNSVDTFEDILIKAQDSYGEVANGTLIVKIIPVNDEPVIIVDGESINYNISTGDGLGFKRIQCKTLYVKEDESIHVKGVSIRDVDCTNETEIIEMTVSAFNGKLLISDHVTMHQWVEGFKGEYHGAMTIRGNINKLNQALEYMSYKPNQHFNGEDFIRVHVSDMGNIGVVETENSFENIALFDTAIIPLQILPIEDKPIIVAPDFLSLEEDSATVISMRISHPDSNQTMVQLHFRCDNGKLKFTYPKGLTFINGTQNNNAYVAAVAEVSSFQRSLSQLVFTPNIDWNNHDKKPDEIVISAHNFVPNQRVQHISTHIIKVHIAEKNDPPLWHIPGSEDHFTDSIPALQILEDNPINISPISISDVDVQNNASELVIRINIRAENGTVKLAKYNGLFVENSKRHIEYIATYQSANEAINQITYTPLPNFNGRDTITLEAIDGEFNETVQIPIVIAAVPDVPVINIPFTISCNEEEWCQIPALTVYDVDMYPKLLLEMSVNKGILAFAGEISNPLRSISILEGNPKGDTDFRFSGTAADLNDVLQRMAYLPLLGSSKSITSFYLTVSVPPDVMVATAKLESSTTTFITIMNSKNNRPYIRYDKSLYYDDPDCPSSYRPITTEIGESNLQLFCNNVVNVPPFECFEDFDCSLRGLTLYDPDSTNLRLIVSVDLGTLTLGNITGIHVIERDTGKNLEIRGCTDHINSALTSLVYRSSPNFVGIDSIDIKIADEDHLFNNDTVYLFEMKIDIIVNGVEDDIKFDGPKYLLHIQKEDELSILPSIAISHAHSVSSDDFINVAADIVVTGGNIKFNSMKGINFTIPNTAIESKWYWKLIQGDDDFFHGSISEKTELKRKMSGMKQPRWWKNVTMCGLLGNINNALKQITFVGNLNSNSDLDNPAEVNVGISRVRDCEAPPPAIKHSGSGLYGYQDYDYDDTLSVLIHVEPVNDAPVLTVGGKTNNSDFINIDSIIIDEDSQAHIPAHVKDVDDHVVQVEISTCFSGSVSVNNDTPGKNNDLFFLQGSAGNYFNHLIIKGTINSLNSHLVNLHFIADANYNDDDCVVDLIVCDDHKSCHSRQIKIITNPVEDPLSLFMPVDSTLLRPLITIKEGHQILLGSDWVNAEVLMMMKVPGPRRLENGRGGEIGKELDLRPLMIGKTFFLSDHENEESYLNNKIDKVACLRIAVDKGMIYFKEFLQNDENLTLFYSNENKNSKVIIARGSIESMNNEITRNLIYESMDGEVGLAQLNITVSREMVCKENQPGNSKKCECDFDIYDVQGSLNIFIKSINSAPQIKWNRYEEALEQQDEVLIKAKVNKTISLHGLQITDSDVNETQTIDGHERIYYGFVTVIFSIVGDDGGGGALSFEQMVGGVTTTIGDGVDDKVVQIMGNLKNVNVALQYLEYKCEPKNDDDHCQVGNEVQIHVIADDNGFTGTEASKKGEFRLHIILVD